MIIFLINVKLQFSIKDIGTNNLRVKKEEKAARTLCAIIMAGERIIMSCKWSNYQSSLSSPSSKAIG